MKCRKCGAEISDGANFCEMCGARVEAEVNETPVANEEVAASSVSESTVEPAAAAETSFAAEKSPFSPIPDEPVKKKGSAAAKVVAGVIGVVALLAILACCSKVVGNTFRKWFLSPEKYLAYVLKDNFGESINDGLSVYDEYVKKAKNPDNVYSNIKFEVALGDEFSKYLADYMDEYSPSAANLSWIKKASLEYGINSYKGEAALGAKLGANGVELITASLIASKDGDIYIYVPELCSKPIYMKVDPEELQEVLNVTDMVNSIYKELPTKPELQKISKKYLKAVFDNVKDVKRTNDVITVEDISAKATVLSMEIDDLLLTNIKVDVLEEFLDDKEFEKIWMRLYDAYEEVALASGEEIKGKADTYEELKENAQKALDAAKEKLSLYEEDKLDNKVKATVKFYVDNKGSISGFNIANGDFTASLLRPAKGGRFGLEAVVEGLGSDSEFDNLTVVGTGKESASVIKAELEAKVDGEKLFDVVINNIDKSIGKKGEGSFDVEIVNINFGETSESDLEVIKEIIGDTNLGFYCKGKVSKKNAETTMSLGNKEKDIFNLTLEAEVRDGSATSIEDKDSAITLDIENESSLADILNAVEEKTLADRLREAGAGEELASTVETYISYFKSLAAYY